MPPGPGAGGGHGAPAAQPEERQLARAGTARAADQAEPQASGMALEVFGDRLTEREARAAYRAGGHDTFIKPGPLRPAVPGGFTVDDFTVDEERGTVTCPAGVTRPMSQALTVTFGAACAGLPAAGTVHHRQAWPVDDHSPARGAAARRPRPGPDPGVQAGLPDPARSSSGPSPGPPPRTDAGSGSAISATSEERRLAARTVRSAEPASLMACTSWSLPRRSSPGPDQRSG